MNYHIEILQQLDEQAYQNYVKNHPSALYEHHLEIRDLVVRYFKFKPLYLIAKEDGKIVGAFPLFHAHSFLEGKRLVSIPFFPFGGIVADSPQIASAILAEAKKNAQNYKFLQIRQRNRLQDQQLILQTPIHDFFLDFKKDEETTFQSLEKSIRYDIRKAQKNDLKVKISSDQSSLNDFYKVYLNTRKKRGVPAWPYGLFHQALQTCSTAVAVTYLNKKPIAAAFLFFHHKEIEYAFAGTDYKYNHLSPYYILIWEIIRYGIQHNYKTLDFGGSTKEMNEGNMYFFKEKWSTRIEPVYYYFYSQNRRNIPTLKNSFNLYKIYGKVWSILPTWIINKISPLVIRQFI